MRFEFNEIEAIPKLAWLVSIERGSEVANVRHGSWVEVGERFFVEGAWNRNFASPHLESSILMGSGGQITSDGLVLACPNHTLDRIYVHRRPNVLLASNSLPFILAAAGDDLDMNFLFYDARLASIIDGIDKYERILPTRNGTGVELYYHCNLHIAADLNVHSKEKERCRDFSSYSDYVGFLREQVVLICANASAPERRVRYVPVATISSGYDSPACAAIAHGAGCQVALTFATARRANADDSGSRIAKALGIHVKTFDRMGYLNKPNFPEAEISGGPSEFSSLDEELSQTALFVGFQGGKVWDRNGRPDTSIVRRDASGFGLTELRLRVGFILMAVPFIGCTSLPSIDRISNSDEMRPWSLGNRYDKPIPRRLLEESGVERNLFGMQKKAAGVYVTEEGIRKTLSLRSFDDFSTFCDQHWNGRFATQSAVAKTARYVKEQTERASRILSRISGLDVSIPVPLTRSLRVLTYGYLGREALLFHWGIRKMMSRYAVMPFRAA